MGGEDVKDTEAQSIISNMNFEFPVNSKADIPELLKSWGSFKKQDLDYGKLGEYNKTATETLNNVNYKYFDIMTIQGAVFIFTIFLFPYVYLGTKSFLEKQSSALIENARVLGKTNLEIFFQVALPISRVPIVGGAILVILEVLSDFGVSSYFGINTFSTAIFTTWFGMYDLN